MNKKEIITNVKKDFERIEELSNSIMDKLKKDGKLNVDDVTLKEITKLNQRIEALYKLYETDYTDTESIQRG